MIIKKNTVLLKVGKSSIWNFEYLEYNAEFYWEVLEKKLNYAITVSIRPKTLDWIKVN